MKNFINRYIIKNWQYKVLSFVIAFILWFYVVSNQSLNIKLNVPIEYDNYPSNLKLAGKVENSAELLLEGRRDIINRIDKNNIKIRIDLKGAREGKNNYIITSKRIENLPDGIIIKDISPSRVVLTFYINSKEIDVKKQNNSKEGQQ